jgi:hypothetical protein
MNRETVAWVRFAAAVVILGLGLASFGAVVAGAHRLAGVLGWALVAVSCGLLATVLARR